MKRHSPLACVILVSCLAAVAVSAGDRAGSEPLPLMPDDAGVRAPELIDNSVVVPSYPFEALVGGGDATVLVGFVVDETGRVDSVNALGSDRPNVGFEKAATRAVASWRYRPAEREGEPVAVFHFVKLRFREPVNRSQMLALGPDAVDAAVSMAQRPMVWGSMRAGGVSAASSSVRGAGGYTGATHAQTLTKMAVPQGCAGNRPCLRERGGSAIEVPRGNPNRPPQIPRPRETKK